MDTRGPSSVSEKPSRRRVLALAGAGGAAVVASFVPQGIVRAGHGGGFDPEALHLGESNTTPTDSTTVVNTDVDNHAFTVRNSDAGEGAGAIRGLTSGRKPAIAAESDADDGVGIDGTSSGPGFGEAENFGEGNGIGVRGTSGSGTGVEGSSGTGTGVAGHSADGTGVSASTENGVALGVSGRVSIEGDIDPGVLLEVTNTATGDGAHAILAMSFGTDKPAIHGEGHGGGPGVSGSSDTSPGVQGRTESGVGVRGDATTGVGVFGLSETKIGVWASAPLPASALYVSGRAVFETAGTGIVPAGANQVTVAAPMVGSDSQVLVTLTGNPGNRELRWVQVNPGVGFAVNLTPAPPNQRPATPFAFLVLDRAT